LTLWDRMPAHDWEIEEAEEEGVVIHSSLGPKKIIVKDGKVAGLETIACISVYDKDRKFVPKFDESKPAPTIVGDTLIIAIGQRSDLTGFEEIDAERGIIKVDKITLRTNIQNIFAGGDIVRGPASVVEAVADGNEAAISIERYLSGKDLKEGRGIEEEKIKEIHGEPVKEPRQIMSKAMPNERKKNFSEVELGFTEDMAIAEAKRCLSCSICSECLQCKVACKAEAIDYEQKEEILDLNVGSLIVTSGYEIFNPSQKSEYGYGRYKNVLSSLEFERLLSASGPTGGVLLRPSDNAHPNKIAFIQCVGSRDEKIGKGYCSAVCCMYATKEAIIAQEHSPGLKTTIFFMDMRAFGKEFDDYYEKAKEEHGVNYVRCRVPYIDELPNKNLRIKYESENGALKEEEFDMVILSVGLQPSEEAKKLATQLGIKLNQYGFCETSVFSPLDTSKEGIYVSGAFSSPKDIPETVAQASGAAAKASALISSERGKLVVAKEYPPEIDVSAQEPRIGAFICHCGINIGGVVNVPEVVEYAKTLPNVVYAEHNLYTCSQDTQRLIKEKIKEHNLNRVIVASCTPRTHEPLFRDTIREAGLNPYLFEMANIRDQCSWVHMNLPKEATEKAKELVRMIVAKARLIQPLKKATIPVNNSALVIGGGISGITASIELADQGFETYLIEKEAFLGGNARKLVHLPTGEKPKEKLEELIKKLEKNKKIHVYTNAEILNLEGYIGNFKTKIRHSGKEEEIEHGIIIVATGAQEYKPKEYLYGKHPNIVTQLEFEELLEKGKGINGKNYVMIQCVGSRNEERSYCSRVCCTNAITNALELKKRNQKANVYVLYRDIRTYGFKEEFFKEAREKGVIFIRYEDEEDKKPIVEIEGEKLKVIARDEILDKKIAIKPDYLILSPAILPNQDNEKLSKLLKIPLSKDKFFLEAHMKLRPLDFATEGIFLCGLAHSPKFIDECIYQACGAAARASTILSKNVVEVEGMVSSVNEDLCSACRTCEFICPYGAIKVDPEKMKAVVTEVLCKGCGTCAAACPKKAANLRHFTDEQLLAQISALAEV
ncbi:MAG: FAD-dependent oxidoreductase, partial [Candidatus Thermoplasmatota archaeon]